jgi:hypothetical protein
MQVCNPEEREFAVAGWQLHGEDHPRERFDFLDHTTGGSRPSAPTLTATAGKDVLDWCEHHFSTISSNLGIIHAVATRIRSCL